MNQLKLVSRGYGSYKSVNHYMDYRVVKIKKGTRKFNVVQAYTNKDTKSFQQEFEEYVKQEIKNQGWIQPAKNKFVYVDVIHYFNRTDIDSNNYWKVVLDVCTKAGVWIDDNIVIERCSRIYYDTKNPRMEITITEADFEGIFDNEEEHKKFQEQCATCTRGKRNCSIHKNALESRIQLEVTKRNGQWVCSAYKKRK